jgi:hypothetical protein
VASGGPRSPCSPSPALRLALPHSLTPPLPPLASSSRARAPASATALVRALAGVGRSGHHNSPPASPSSSEHRLLFAQPVLALARSGNAPILSNCSSEIGHAHREEPLRGHLLSASPLALFSRARALHRVPDALERLHSPCRGQGRLISDDPRRRFAMHGGWLPELLGPRRGHRWVSARVGITPVILAWPETSPSTRSRRLASSLLSLADGWGPLDPRAHLSVSLC